MVPPPHPTKEFKSPLPVRKIMRNVFGTLVVLLADFLDRDDTFTAESDT
jgi:hypothetical protein